MDERSMRKTLLAGLEARLPERAPLLIAGWTTLTSGWANNIFAFDLQDAAGRVDKLILKQFTVTAKADKEARALAALAGAGYSVPRVLLAQDELIVMERVDGQTLWSLYEAGSEAQRGELAALLVRLLVDLQALDARLLAAEPNTEAVPMQEIKRLRADERTAFRPVIDWLEAQRVPCPRAVISHRDYHPWNVLVEPSGQARVIDWDWEIADPRFDLAWLLMLMARSGFANFSAAARSIYEQMNGGAVELEAYFEVLTTIRWLMNVTRSLASGANLRTDAADDFRVFLAAPIRSAQALIEAQTGIVLRLD